MSKTYCSKNNSEENNYFRLLYKYSSYNEYEQWIVQQAAGHNNIMSWTHLLVQATEKMLSEENWKSLSPHTCLLNNKRGTSSFIMTLIIYNGFRYDKNPSSGINGLFSNADL